jgi:hypothetical protein
MRLPVGWRASAFTVNEEMKLAAAHAIARTIPAEELHADCIVPSVFNRAQPRPLPPQPSRAVSPGASAGPVRTSRRRRSRRWIGRSRIARQASEGYAATSISEPPMTQQYLIGQFSTLLEELKPSAGDGLAAAVHDLRREVECSSVEVLPRLASEAIGLTDKICCGALERGDTSGFLRYAKAAAALGEFMDAAELLPD